MARRGVCLTIGVAACGLILGSAPAAMAQVLSIGDDGAVTTYSGPQVFTSAGARPIAPLVPAALRATPAEVQAAIQESSARHAVPAPVVDSCQATASTPPTCAAISTAAWPT